MAGVKPGAWAVDRGVITPAFRNLWAGLDFLLPFFEQSGAKTHVLGGDAARFNSQQAAIPTTITRVPTDSGLGYDFPGVNFALATSYVPPAQGTFLFVGSFDSAGATSRVYGSHDRFELVMNKSTNFRAANNFYAGGGNVLNGPFSLTPDTVHAVTCTWNLATTTLELYYNGVLVGIDTVNANDTPTSATLLMGGRSATLFDGKALLVAQWNRVLGAGDIQLLQHDWFGMIRQSQWPTFPATGGVVIIPLNGAAQAVAVASGSPTQTQAVTAATTAVVQTAGTAAQTHALTGTVSSVGQASGVLTLTHALTGATTTVAVTSGAIEQVHAVTVAVDAVVATIGTLEQTHVLTGDSVVVASAVGTLTVVGVTPVTGAASAVTQVSGTLTQTHALTVTVDSVVVAAGTPEQVHAVTVDVVAVAAASGVLTIGGQNDLAGSAQTIAVTTAALEQTHVLTAAIDTVSETVGTPTQTHQLVGDGQAVVATTATVDITKPLNGAAQTVASVTATTVQVHRLTADSVAVTAVTATLKVTKSLTVDVEAVAQAVGTLTVTVVVAVSIGSNGVDDVLVGSLAVTDGLADASVGSMGVDDV